MNMLESCPCCGGRALNAFFKAQGVPVNSCLSLQTRAEAIAFPVGDIVLKHCRACGFVFNAAFDERLLEYSERYDPTQAFSETFNRWHRALAERLVEQYDLKGRKIIEIGCGKGEFLAMLCTLGSNHGIGFDPAFASARSPTVGNGGDARFVADFYSEKYREHVGDFVCCKMTLEHISPALDFVTTVRRALDGSDDPVVFFQVPDVRRILEEQAFWDIYYEHCSYFSAGSLARVFGRAGFEVTALAREYGEQYLMIESRVVPLDERKTLPEEDDLMLIGELVERFQSALPQCFQAWRDRLAGFRAEGKRTVIWGAGSKGVSFLTTLGITTEIEYAVDINPHRAGLYMAKTGQEIVGPDFLREYRPDVVIVMNPVYRPEIEQQLRELDLRPLVLTT